MEYATQLPGRKNTGMTKGGAIGLIVTLMIFLLFIIFILVFVISVKDQQTSYASCAYYTSNISNTSGNSNNIDSPTPTIEPSTAPQQSSTAVKPLTVGPSTAGPSTIGPSTTAPSTGGPSTGGPSTGEPSGMSTATTKTSVGVVGPSVDNPSEQQNDRVCESTGCVIKAGQILEYAGSGRYDKCKEFVSYACSGWKMSHPIPDHEAEFNLMKKTENEVALIMKGLLENARESNVIDAKRASAFYHSCMNRSAIENYGLVGIQQLIGAWPILQPSWTSGNMFQYDLTANIENSIIRGFPVFFDLYVGRDPRNVSAQMLLLEEPELGMKNKAYYVNPEFSHKLEAFSDLALKTAVLMGADERRAATEVNDMVSFEVELAKILKHQRMRGFPFDFIQLRISDLNSLTTKIDWLRLFGQVIKGVNTQDLKIGILDYNFLNRIAVLINSTSVRTLGNYVTWKFVLQNLDHLPRDFQTINWWYEMTRHDTPAVPARWRKCLQQTIDNFPYTSEKLYYSLPNRYFNSGSISMVSSIFDSLKSIVRENLVLNQWMDDGTRQYALEKLTSLDLYFVNETSSNMEYSNMSITEEPFLYNLLRIRPQKTSAHLQFDSETKPLSLWQGSPLSLNIFYDYHRNRVVIPSVAFHLPYLTPISTRSFNYATIGKVLSREIVKAIDNMGSNFDKSGNFAPWWSTETTDNYNQRLRCLSNKYSQINVTQINRLVDLEGTVTDIIMENIALEVAFSGYKWWSSSQPTADQFLPSLDVRSEELFFISYSQMNCGEIRKEKYIDYLISSQTVPEPYRTNATLSQNSAFIATFRCLGPASQTRNENCALF